MPLLIHKLNSLIRTPLQTLSLDLSAGILIRHKPSLSDQRQNTAHFIFSILVLVIHSCLDEWLITSFSFNTEHIFISALLLLLHFCSFQFLPFIISKQYIHFYSISFTQNLEACPSYKARVHPRKGVSLPQGHHRDKPDKQPYYAHFSSQS